MTTTVHQVLECVLNVMHKTPHKFPGKLLEMTNLSTALVKPVLQDGLPFTFTKYVHLVVQTDATLSEAFDRLERHPDAEDKLPEEILQRAPKFALTWTAGVALRRTDGASYFDVLNYIYEHPASLVELFGRLKAHVEACDINLALVNVLRCVRQGTIAEEGKTIDEKMTDMIEALYDNMDNVFDEEVTSFKILSWTDHMTTRPTIDDVLTLLGNNTIKTARYLLRSRRGEELSELQQDEFYSD